MSIGTGIFLSAIFLGIVALFIATKDRWNWKKIILWPIGVLVSVSVVLGVGLWIYSVFEDRAQPQTTFWDIPIDATRNDLKFLKGKPMLGEDNENSWIYSAKKANFLIFDIESKKSVPLYVVLFEGNKLHSVFYKGDWSSETSIQGINIGSSYERIVEKFGPPTNTLHSKDGFSRRLFFKDYNVFFTLKENEVTSLGMYNTKIGEVGFID